MPETLAPKPTADPFARPGLPPSRLFAMSLFWFAINLHWGALLTVVVPGQVASLRPDTQAQTLGMVLGLGALVALIVTPIAGALSDRCAARLGRRRPFMGVGTVVNCVGLAGMAVAFGASSLAGYLGASLSSNSATTSRAAHTPASSRIWYRRPSAERRADGWPR
jgi:MFS family permease